MKTLINSILLTTIICAILLGIFKIIWILIPYVIFVTMLGCIFFILYLIDKFK